VKRFIIQTVIFALLLSVGVIHAQTVSIWHTENDPLTIFALDAIAKRFEAKNPGVHIQMVSVGWDDLYRKLTLALQAQEVPTLTQIEPFMGAYLYSSGQLQPLDDTIADLHPDDIFPAVRDLQLFDGKRYGIATALGISYYSYRKDYLVDPNAHLPTTWADYLSFVQQAHKAPPSTAPLLLPANDLHITLLFTELLASDGGSLFDANGNPSFDNPKVIETLRYWQRLFQLVPPDLRNSPYKENFTNYALGRAFSLPCFFGRGTLQIERDAPESERSPENFAMFPHIVGPSGTKGFATLDAEPWVVLKGSPHPDIARKFLRFFYQKENYLQFAGSVPIHLTPIYRSLALSSDYTSLPLVQKWRPYHDYEIKMLDEGSVLPIFMARTEDRLLPALFKLEGSRVVSGMVRDVSQNGLTPEEAVRKAMGNASSLMQGLPARVPPNTLAEGAWPRWFLIALVVFAIAVAGALYARRTKTV
jgi:multiple sugar transport system substrate-binding protein